MISWRPGLRIDNAAGTVNPTSLGYQYTIQTTTQIAAKVVEQIFYEVPFEDFVNVEVGFGAWMENIKINTVFQLAGSFFNGLMSLNQGSSKLPIVNVGLSPVTSAIDTWTSGYTYTIAEVNKALASNNWDVVEDKMRALKKMWDLGLQQVAFLGNPQDQTNFPGLLTQTGATVNTSIITQFISSYSPGQFAAFVANIIATYFPNTNYTRMPNRFVIPYADWNGLMTPVSSQFPNVDMLSYLENAFKRVTGRQDFKIMPVAYCDTANNGAEIGHYRYALYNKDPDTIRMYIPVDFMLNPAGTGNNWQWEGVACGQFGSPVLIRPNELMYFDHS